MRRAAVLIVWLVVLAPAASAADGVTADEVVRRVAETYATLKSFRLVQTEELRGASFETSDGAAGQPQHGPAPLGYSDGRYLTDLTASQPGSLRLVLTYGQGTILLVADNESTWLYLPSLNQYFEEAAAPLLKQMWARYPDRWVVPLSPFGLDDLAAYAGLSVRKGEARLRGLETLHVGAEEVPCYVLSVPPRQQFRTLWVDKERFLVVRDERDLFADAISWWSQLEDVHLGPEPRKAFHFAAPTGAQRVDSFGPLKSYAQRAEGLLADHLLGADLLRAMEGKRAPDFKLNGVDGGAVRLDDRGGKIVLLNFFATWCKPCREELAMVQKLHRELKSKGVVFVGIDEDEDLETAKNFAKQSGYTFPVLVDSGHTVPELYRTGWVPTAVVINRKGKIAAQYIGAGGEPQLRRALKSAGLNTPP